MRSASPRWLGGGGGGKHCTALHAHARHGNDVESVVDSQQCSNSCKSVVARDKKTAIEVRSRSPVQKERTGQRGVKGEREGDSEATRGRGAMLGRKKKPAGVAVRRKRRGREVWREERQCSCT